MLREGLPLRRDVRTHSQPSQRAKWVGLSGGSKAKRGAWQLPAYANLNPRSKRRTTPPGFRTARAVCECWFRNLGPVESYLPPCLAVASALLLPPVSDCKSKKLAFARADFS